MEEEAEVSSWALGSARMMAKYLNTLFDPNMVKALKIKKKYKNKAKYNSNLYN